MVDIKTWISDFASEIEKLFGNRVWFIGLQGSYGRGEATEKSDIDVVVILDELRADDLKAYRDMLGVMPNGELVCGFISGKNELLNWEASDLFQFYYDTTSIKGTLDCLLERINKQAVKRAIRIGACNIYHACAHNFVHEKDENVLRSLYKAATFVIQAVWFYETGKYLKSNTELQNAIFPPSAVLSTALELRNGADVQLDEMSTVLLNWASAVIEGYKE